MKIWGVVLVLLGLTGCTRTVYVAQKVDVPIMVHCKAPEMPPFVSYVVHDPQSSPGQVVSGLVATLWEAEKQNDQLREIIQICTGGK